RSSRRLTSRLPRALARCHSAFYFENRNRNPDVLDPTDGGLKQDAEYQECGAVPHRILKYEKLEDLILKGRCDPLGKLFARNGRDAERRILRRAPPDAEVKKVAPLGLRDLPTGTQRC